MGREQHPLTPSLARVATGLGKRIELARARRGISTVLFSERMGIHRSTLQRVEAGDPGVSLGTYLKALRALGMEADIDKVAADDVLGRKLQDAAALQTHGRSAD